jgi:hypothetical protein
LPVSLRSTGPDQHVYAHVELVSGDLSWPGMPIIAVVDDRSAIVGFRQGNEVRGHWSTAPAFVAAARLALERFGAPNG